MTCFICEKDPARTRSRGLTIPPKIKKMGYKGVESTELVFDGFKVPEDRVLGGPDGLGQGFVQMMDAWRSAGSTSRPGGRGGPARPRARASLQPGAKDLRKPIAQHQAISFKLAEMGTRLEAARLLTMKAARLKDAGERSDLEAGMAKLFASEAGKENAEECLRIHGGYGYSKEYEIERIYRDAPLLLIGEGTSEIQKMVIGEAARAAQDLMAQGARELISIAYRKITVEVPALAKLKLVFRLELRGRGDVQVFRVRVPGPEISKADPEDARVEVSIPLPLQRAGRRRQDPALARCLRARRHQGNGRPQRPQARRPGDRAAYGAQPRLKKAH